MENSEKKLLIGLDIGTNSVGWAATDDDFNILRIKGKDAWGVRLFDSANGCKDRRNHRQNKRRISRRNNRIYLLNKIFAPYIKDEDFFKRLNESNLVFDDKTTSTKSVFFKTLSEEREYYKKYPTIWKLRYDLVSNKEEAISNIKFIYIALHHIIKYRGNFLHQGEVSFDTIDSCTFDALNDILNNIRNELNGEIEAPKESFFTEVFEQEIIRILCNNDLYTKDKKKAVKNLFEQSILKESKEISIYVDMFSTLVSGGKFSANKIEKYSEFDELKDISFLDGYENKADALETNYSDLSELIKVAKTIYDYAFIKNLLGNSSCLSQSFYNAFLEHKDDLKCLKKLVKQIDLKTNIYGSTSLYSKTFLKKSEEDSSGKQKALDNYVAFIKKQDKNFGSASLESFYAFCKSNIFTVENYSLLDDEDKLIFNNLKSKLEKNKFLLKSSDISNSAIPHQLHEQELIKIIDNCSKNFPFLEENKSNIIKLFKFKVPYYLGPLSGINKSQYSNVVLKDGISENTKVTFNNYENVIDFDKSKENFIKKLINDCSYLKGKKVLPFSSLYYTYYIILDRLNTMTINGVKMTSKEKRSAIRFICGCKEVTVKKLIDFLKKTNLENRDKEDFDKIGGINPDDKFVGYPINVFCNFYGEDIYKNIDKIEAIISILTIYKDSKYDGFEVIKKKFKISNDSKELSFIKSLNFNKWGRLSYELLNGIVNDNDQTVLNYLENTNYNFQQVIEYYGFKSLIKQNNDEIYKEYSVEEKVNEIIESAPAIIRRPIVQAKRIVDEILSLSKFDKPDVISIEVTREDRIVKKKTVKRRKEIETFIKQLMKGYKGDYDVDFETLLKDLGSISDNDIKGKSIYLYFKQLGYDLYTGKKIDLDRLLSSNDYDVDHIVPQSLIKDDSLDNTVLVSKNINQKVKKDIYPVPSDIYNDQIGLWKFLKDKGAISQKKYNNLTRRTEISEAERKDFINRQINVVDYANKAIKDVFELLYPKTKIIFSKATYPSELRRKYKLAKVRELNNTHHAVDAYLNIVSGTVLNEIYGNLGVIKARKNNSETALINLFEEDKEVTEKISKKSNKLLISLLSYLKYNNLKEKVVSNCLKRSMLMTQRISYSEAEFYKETIHSPIKYSSLIPLHTKGAFKNTDNYGGYSSLKHEFFVIGKYYKKDKIQKILISIPRLYSQLYKDQEKIAEEIRRKADIKDLDIDFGLRIYNNQTIIVDGVDYLLQSNNEQLIKLKTFSNAFLSKLNAVYLKDIYKYKERLSEQEENENSIELKVNRLDLEPKTFSKEKNNSIFNELYSIAKSNRFMDSGNFERKFKNFDWNLFYESSVKEQISFILSLVDVLNDRDVTPYRPTVGGFLNTKEVKIKYQSVTGLISRTKKL